MQLGGPVSKVCCSVPASFPGRMHRNGESRHEMKLNTSLSEHKVVCWTDPCDK